MSRATETAREIVAASGRAIETIVDADWIELDYGTFDGLRQSEIEPTTWSQWRADPNFRPPVGSRWSTWRAGFATR